MKQTITKLNREINRNEKRIDTLQDRNYKLQDAVDKLMLGKHGFKKGDYIVGSTVVCNKKCKVVARVERVYMDYDWNTEKSKVVVEAATVKDKTYAFKVNDVRAAGSKERAEFDRRYAKWINS